MLELINSYLWDKCCLFLLVLTGAYMLFRTRFFQFRHIPLIFGKTVRSLFSPHGSEYGISRFGAVCTALAATLGVGNIAGVSVAIAMGGPGAVFWMWFSALFGCATAYGENVLGLFFRSQTGKGESCGGAMYYLRDGLGKKSSALGRLGKPLAALFSFFCITASFGIGNAAQANTIAANMKASLNIPALSIIAVGKTDLYLILLGILLSLITATALLGGISRIAGITEMLVPVMVIGYISGCGIIIIRNADRLLPAVSAIFRFAFVPRAAAGGVTGAAISSVIGIGFRRGMFSSEAGLGSSVIVNSASPEREPAIQGMWGIFEVFTDTVIICSITAFCILCSGLVDLKSGYCTSSVEATALVTEAFFKFFGNAGGIFIAVSVLLFALGTILGWAYYGTVAWEYLFGKGTEIYKLLYVLFVFAGANTEISLIWALSDLANALMMLPNLVGILLQGDTVTQITDNFLARTVKKKRVTPLIHNADTLKNE